MLIISPRSYVTAAFDLIFPTLLEHVFEKLKSNTNWWKDIVCAQKEHIFKNANDVLDQIYDDYVPEEYYELFDYFDEHSLCKLVLSDGARGFFSKGELDIFDELQKIRIQWAHRKYRQTADYDDEKPKRIWAESAINYFRYVAYYLKKPELEKCISILLFKMKCDWIDDDTDLRSHSELIEWLYENVVEHVIDPDSPVTKETKERVENSFNNLIDYANAASPKTASRYVVDYYWNAIRGKTDVYEEIKTREKRIPTFEDVVEDFTKFCYKTR